MLNSSILDIVIGLIFIYLLYSLMATIIQEIIASQFSFRAKILERAVFRMLEDENKFASKFRSVWYLFKRTGNGGAKNSMTYEYYKHPLILFLGESDCRGKPAYINKETFSKVIVDLLRGKDIAPGDDVKILIQKSLDSKTTNWGNAKISEQTLSYLKSIWADANGDIVKFKHHLEFWFEETMDRASTWYKKHVQFVLFFVGLAISIVFNVDTLKIIERLEKDPKLREQLVLQANAFQEAHPDLDKKLLLHQAEINKFQANYSENELRSNDSLRNIELTDSLELANYLALKSKRDDLFDQANTLIKNDIKSVHHSLGLGWESYDSSSFASVFYSMVGWIVTALALSLGAPFWFDLLNKLMKLRGSVATPTSDDKEKKQG
jgi:hypothetical protein